MTVGSDLTRIFISYTAQDRPWAEWIGVTLRDKGYEPFVHDWEIAAGQNIPRWMEEKINAADRLLGVFSDNYVEAIYSKAERTAAFWFDADGSEGFLVPVEVKPVTNWPRLVMPLKRLSLVGLDETEIEPALLAFLEAPKAPTTRPPFPGKTRIDRVAEAEASNTFIEDSEPLPANRPPLPRLPTYIWVDYDNSPVVTASGRVTTHNEAPKGSELRAAEGFFLQPDTPLPVNNGAGCFDFDKIVILSLSDDERQLAKWVNRHVTIEGKLGRFVSALVHPSIYIEVITISGSDD